MIKDISNHVNGQLDMQLLCHHYGSEGNASCCWIATAQKLHETPTTRVSSPSPS